MTILVYICNVHILFILMSDMQKMLDICVAASLDMKINIKKSNWLRIGG